MIQPQLIKLMNYNNTSKLVFVSIAVLTLHSGEILAQGDKDTTLAKINSTKKELQEKQTPELFTAYKKMLESDILTTESKQDKIKIYSEMASVVRSMIVADYDPDYIAPTSIPSHHLDPTQSSGSDPSQIADPVKRQRAIDAQKALDTKLAKHNFQRYLREQLASITLRVRAEVGVANDENAIDVQRKLEKLGLTRDEVNNIFGEATAAIDHEEK